MISIRFINANTPIAKTNLINYLPVAVSFLIKYRVRHYWKCFAWFGFIFGPVLRLFWFLLENLIGILWIYCGDLFCWKIIFLYVYAYFDIPLFVCIRWFTKTLTNNFIFYKNKQNFFYYLEEKKGLLKKKSYYGANHSIFALCLYVLHIGSTRYKSYYILLSYLFSASKNS